MAFNPKPNYTKEQEDIKALSLAKYRNFYITRPPYQRKSVWSTEKKQALLDSLFRGDYIPRLVLREVRFSDGEAKYEVIDGQQRITAVQDFFDGEYKLPASLGELDKRLKGYYEDLDDDIKMFIDEKLKFQADIIHGIDKADEWEHQKIAIRIFSRLQEGVSLNYMEKAHAQLASRTRNFIAKYADDESFDYEEYKPVDKNPDLHNFFKLLSIDGKRMKHAQIMARFVLISKDKSSADIKEGKVTELVHAEVNKNGDIKDNSFENEKIAKETLETLNILHSIFKEGMTSGKNGIVELSAEYFILSLYLLIMYLRKNYAIDDEVKSNIRDFVRWFHVNYQNQNDLSEDVVGFRDNKQLGGTELRIRDKIMRHAFFKYLKDKGKEIKPLDEKRAFGELERIQIYRNANGICQKCLEETGKENESKIDWDDFHADHVVPHSKGGETSLENAQLLCRKHNLSKGSKLV